PAHSNSDPKRERNKGSRSRKANAIGEEEEKNREKWSPAMPTGFVFYTGSGSITFDSEYGLSWNPSPPKPARRCGLVASEENFMNYLTEYGVDNIKSVKLVEPKFPKNSAATRCNNLLRKFAERMSESENAEYYRKALLKYCGVDIDY
ncbi:unnamed protein product, partial [Linum tenue]